MSAIALFKHTTPAELLAKAVTLHESETGSKRVGLLPANSKTGECLAKISGLKGQALKRWKRERQEELKVAMSKEFGGLAANPEFVGRSMTVSKTGVIGFFLEPSGVSKAETSKVAAAEERAKEAVAQAEMAERMAELAEKRIEEVRARLLAKGTSQEEMALLGL